LRHTGPGGFSVSVVRPSGPSHLLRPFCGPNGGSVPFRYASRTSLALHGGKQEKKKKKKKNQQIKKKKKKKKKKKSIPSIHLLDALVVEILVVDIVDGHHRRIDTRAGAFDLADRELTIGGRLPILKNRLFIYKFLKKISAKKPKIKNIKIKI
jgi:hypothetical protein